MIVKLEPRMLMERAIEAMRQSVAEPRADGKASPLVGAALWWPDGTIETAYRGELRDGDHAEYGLLERKNRAKRLDDTILFATLEPCAPGSRRHPKLGCAERIALSRIKEVWIGIEDPDPLVDRKGIKFLQDSGVTVHMFDHDLQQVIQDANSVFIEQALERAIAAREKVGPKAILLSPLENAWIKADMRDLSLEAMKHYLKIANIDESVGSEAFARRLVQHGLLKQEDGKSTPTGFGLLLFGKEPRTIMPQAGLLGTIHFADGTEELKDFDGPQVLAPEQALQWLRNKLPNPVDRSAGRRREKNEAFFELVREGVVNALVHRDYSIEGAKCQLVVTTDTIIVKSPGRPVEPIKLEQLQAFNAPMLSRNPSLHLVFARMELAEERGLGLKSLAAYAEKEGLPFPKFSWEDPYLVLTLFRTAEAATSTLDEALRRELTSEEQAGWIFLTTRVSSTATEYAKYFNVSARTAQRHLTHFVELGMLSRQGNGPSTKYLVLRP